ncbi:hypothetical protein OBBRIDRAFT_399158 [Obba rivulosa]|uniref:BTB domain-containing protein n=1 Tax=Obba rivulosa TaxID=1052685 RepID=A0A8E2AJG2_9APHY|nr:hypothetical protein OBBRIDRAFT_399158 [Obba rivulosa]
MAASAPDISCGTHPFSFPSADVIFLSSDNITFRVHKIILALASEFFAMMFTLPQSVSASARSSTSDVHDIEQAELDGLPLLRVAESGLVLENLFRLCYPIDDPILTDLDEVGASLQAAMKYDLQEATKLLKERLIALVAADPLRAYAIACRYSLEDVAATAADKVLRSRIQVKYINAMDHITAGAYYRLLRYCQLQGNVCGSWVFCEQVTMRSNRLNLSGLRTAYLPSIDNPPTDALMRCSDSTVFKVHCTVLCMASSILQEKFCDLIDTHAATGLPEDNQQRRIDIPDDNWSGFALLRMCYDSDVELDSIDEISAALTLARKYGVKKAIRSLTRKLSSYADRVPVQVYFIACQFGLTKAASEAAKMSLSSELEPLCYDVMEEVSAKAYHQLQCYRRTCGKVATAVITDGVRWVPYLHRLSASVYGPPACFKAYPTNSTSTLLPCWCRVYLDRALSTSEVNNCRFCKNGIVVTEFSSVSAALAKLIENAVTQVKFQFT